MRFIALLPLGLSAFQVAAAQCTITALGTGKDDAPQLLTAVKACSTVTIPSSTTLNISSPLNMTGLSNKHLNLEGTIKFNPSVTYWSKNGFPFSYQTQITYWILGGTNLLLDGGGLIDGSGQAWYDAFASDSSLLRPVTLTLYQATNVVVQNIRYANSPEWFNFVNGGKNVTFNNVTLSAVSTSKNGAVNTDGWDIYLSDTVTIKNSVINNGDDCVSFKPNTTNVLVSGLSCNGSHGISVGSLGQYAGIYDIVENITATNIKMSNAQNGARIKCWAGSGVGSGIVKNITFEFFTETAVENPVCYETSSSECSEFPSNTLIQDIFFTNITGTGTSSTVADLGCSPDSRCSDINVNNLSLSYPSGTAKYTCQNVQLSGNSASLFGTCKTT
ncbi:Protein kinase domain-containing protein [Mycena chlorophos]|uniref:galacturonan 1,4-alpha-galacturonidase n=1 Tax=Mycena chlorophos TaxID=658473 RepID=A0A8H6SBU7_MYCCL|nr:Protein kinase domain-containing protein [Mycena chlorophos]